MSVTLLGKSGAKYEFDGPFTLTGLLENRPGVFVVVSSTETSYRVIDVGESLEIQRCVDGHKHLDCWCQTCSGRVRYAAHYVSTGGTPSISEIAQDIRLNYDPPCAAW